MGERGREGGGSGLEGARKRVIKSLKHHKVAMGRFLPAFLQALAPVDPTQSRALLKRLSTMVQEGEAPSFAGRPPPFVAAASPPALLARTVLSPTVMCGLRACGFRAQIRELGLATSGDAWSTDRLK
jgi:hypothetical protein